MDRLRAYRRWRIRRISLLLPVFLAALATQLWLVVGSSAPAWVRVVSLGTSGLILALIGYFLAQTLVCARLQTRGDRAAASAVREQLVPSGRTALAAAAVLAMLNTIPYLVPADPARAPLSASKRRSQFRSEGTSSAPGPVIELEPLPSSDLLEVPAPIASRPEVRPILEPLPLRLAVEDSDVRPDIPATLAFLRKPEPEPERRPPPEQEEENPRYRPDVKDGFQLLFERETPLTFARLGVPDERNPDEWLPPELRIEVSLLRGPDRGTEFSLHLDIPISRDESLRADIALAHLSGSDFLGESPAESWQRVTFSYSYRVAGYTRQAPFDLAFSIGIAADRYRLQGEDGRMDAGARISPYVAIDAAIWQQGMAGLLLHAGYSIPVNATGASSGILDLSAAVRIDLTENISIYAGYRYLLVRLRDYEEAFSGPRSGQFSDSFSGPILGIDIRF